MIYMEHPQKNRFYLLLVEQDLFNMWLLKRVFGGIFNNHRRTIVQDFSSEEGAWAALTEVEYQKRQHGYVYVDTFDVRRFALRPQTISEVVGSRFTKPKSVKETSLSVFSLDQQELPF